MKERWFIVANRLPIITDPETGKLVQASGGLVSALANIKTKKEKLWVGALNPPKVSLPKHLKPVYIEKNLYAAYYNGLANDVLWPLFHYETDSVKFSWENWEAYKKVNLLFAQNIAKIARKNDLIWIHDYHLFLMPYYLRQLRPELKIGFFLHIPFPGSEVFRQLPVREEVLSGLLACDLIGFQDYTYLNRFCRSIHTLLGIDSNLMNIDYEGREIQLGVFPVSIDTGKFIRAGKSKKVKDLMDNLRLIPRYEKLILGVDRLDYSKGIDFKLLAFRELLEKNPDLIGKVCLLQIAVPSRVHVEEYAKLRENIERLVGNINGEFGNPFYVPVQYLFTSVGFHELVALYRYAHVLLITSKRDGMNLVSQEYIASQNPDDPGVLLLSEFAGAISNLSHVIPINPWNISDTASKIKRALDMNKEERIALHKPMLKYLEKYTATTWAESFLKRLSAVKSIKHGAEIIHFDKLPQKIQQALSQKKIIFLDYDGTLAPIVSNPEDAKISSKMKNLLKKMSRFKDFEIVVISGRDARFILEQVKDISIAVACEHGAIFYPNPSTKPVKLVRSNIKTWYPVVKRIMLDYCARVPGSFVEEKSYGISWHYRGSPDRFAVYQARKLSEELETGLTNEPLSILHGKKVVEARAIEANKGSFARWYVDRYAKSQDTIIALGDDATDEELFEALNHRAISIKVGQGPTSAKYRLPSQEDVFPFLQSLLRS
ncbi:MAG: bifunctional alpha,alpha-trehalose-phosphate synthase (UDP-forming)/trehalose-phosphatase [Candidatus Hydrogenedentota bacterium]|nr:MAG: bifunctional alpha,alpha-trehalose-phosphate synthase (UDP-forming)/trehalose-phosphatase [Candidatus Hydrogenedentota bacterium]